MKQSILLNSKYSTTRLVFKTDRLVKNTNSLCGGLRTQGYIKKSINGTPLLSIITVVYNGETYIEETIKSVIYQNYDNVEYIIIDGNSTDNTLNIIKKYENEIDYWISEQDNGMYDALSKAFKLVSGDLMGWINADDFYFPNTFKTVASIFHEHKDVDWITGLPVIYNKDGSIIRVANPWGFNIKNIQQGLHGLNRLEYVQQESTFWRTTKLNTVDLNIFKSFKLAGDFYLWKHFSLTSSLYLVESCLSGFRKHLDQLSSNTEKYKAEFLVISDKLPICWRIKILGYKLLKLCPDKLKQMYGKNRIYYNTKIDKWVKNG